MDIKELKQNWDTMGKHDPLWAILTDDSKRGNKWSREEFFKTGEQQIAKVFRDLKADGIAVHFGNALDFGCGVGRLTQPLCNYFEKVNGVDIAPSMIQQAEEFNQHKDKCRYWLNSADNLSLFSEKSFDFIFSCIVLQHMQPEYAKKYIREFIRLLTPQGIAVFQVPSEFDEKARKPKSFRTKVLDLLPSPLVKQLRKANGIGGAVMEMYGINKTELIEFMESSGANIIQVKADGSPGTGWSSYQYIIKRA